MIAKIKATTIVIMLSLLLFGCSTNIKKVKIPLDFNCPAQIVLKGESYTGAITRQIDGQTDFIVTTPSELSGWAVTMKGRDVTTTFKGITWQGNSPMQRSLDHAIVILNQIAGKEFEKNKEGNVEHFDNGIKCTVKMTGEKIENITITQ